MEINLHEKGCINYWPACRSENFEKR